MTYRLIVLQVNKKIPCRSTGWQNFRFKFSSTWKTTKNSLYL